MKILVDVLHPAHVHFFRNAVDELRSRGHTVLLTARDKDIARRLLDGLGYDYRVLSAEARGLVGRARELAARNAALMRIVRDERPDVMASIAGVSTAPVGFLTGTRNYIFYDTENAVLSNAISYPFATEVVTPDCYRRRVWGRHVTYPGYHELAYVHPRRFTPDPAVLRGVGVDPEEPFSVVRFVSWRALHDTRKPRGFTLDEKRELVHRLRRLGRVFITSEDPLPDDMEEHRLVVAPHQVHHLMAFARLFVGESSTMASESCALGTPAVYVDALGTCYTDELEERYGLCWNFRPGQFEAVAERACEVVASELKVTEEYRGRVRRMLDEKTDVTELIVSKLLGTG